MKLLSMRLLLGKASTIAEVGYFLERNEERFFVNKNDLQTLKNEIPKQPHYMDKKLKGSLVKQWNLIVPDKIHRKAWSEVL